MGRLVQIHEVHVNRGPGNLAVELRVEVYQRLMERLEPGDPHLGGRERVHPGRQANAVRLAVGSLAHVKDRLGRGKHGFTDNADRQLFRISQTLSNDSCVIVNFDQRFFAVKILTACDEPHFELIEL